MNELLLSRIQLIFCYLLFSFGLNAQVVSIQEQNISLEAFFDSLTNKTAIDIAYDVHAIPNDSIINVSYDNQHALEIVKDILENNAVDIVYLNGQIIISKSIVDERQPKSIRIIGNVKDVDANVALPLVNVTVVNKPLGTISNAQGQFEFKVPTSYANEKLAFSFLGYHTSYIEIPLKDTTINVLLRPTTVKLDEVEIAYKDPREIVSFLKSNHHDNYWDKQAVLSGFFRETIRQDSDYVQVSEAIVKIIKPSYANPSHMERVKFIKGRKKNDLQSMDFVNFKLEGGPFQFSRLDVARYRDFFSDDNSHYKYSYDGIDVLDEEIVYKVRFRPQVDDGELLYEGLLYIHSKSFALVRAEFDLTNKALRTSGKTLIKKATRKIKVKPLKASYYIDYRFYEGRWILNRVDGEIVIRINDKRQKVNSVFTAVSELLISDWQLNDSLKLKPSELYKSKYVLADQIIETDNDFWEDYNIIRPDEELEKVFKKTKVVSK